MTKEIIKAGALRSKLYKVVESLLERTITKAEHNIIRDILQEFKQTVAPIEDQKRIEHTYLCEKCGGKKVGFGKKFRYKMKRIKPPLEDTPIEGETTNFLD